MSTEKIKLKEARELSGIYFRFKNHITGSFENRVFEDLPEEKQDEVMNGRSDEWIKSLAKQLAATINNIGNHYGIKRNNDGEESDPE